MNTGSYQKAIEVCRTLIGIKTSVVDVDIDNAVNSVVLMFPNLRKMFLRPN